MSLKSKTKKKIPISFFVVAIIAVALICIYHFFFFQLRQHKGEKLMGPIPLTEFSLYR